ncbi:Predicted protein [Streptococcus thermophilus LMD-9]|nr:Predicted protein [Streptococcus thermophilus LMD-9]
MNNEQALSALFERVEIG